MTEPVLGRPCGVCRWRGGIHAPDCPVTGPVVPPGGEEPSSEIGRVLAEHQTILYGVDSQARCTCGWVGDDSSWGPTLHRRDVLLPVVDRIARQRAAEELRAAYWATAAIPDPEAVRDVVLARAAALTPERTTP